MVEETYRELLKQIIWVAKARAELQRITEIRQTAMAKWERDNKEMLDSYRQATEDQATEEAGLRELTLQVYAETGNKKPAEGVGIREITKLEYDPKEALKWAMHHQIALSLDKKSFEGFAKATPVDFVTITVEPQATIATDLSSFIGEAPAQSMEVR